MSKKTVIYILPHHDDEMFVIPKINKDLQDGHHLKFFFLMKSELRMKESQIFLTALGVKNEDIISIGKKFDVKDGVVHLSLENIYNDLYTTLSNLENVDEIVCTAYEGGHNDHDVAAILSRALAKKINVKVLEFYLYNGYGTFGKIYKVASPGRLTKKLTYRYRLNDFMAFLKAPFVFVSQISAMLGLWPFLFLKIIFLRPLTLNVLNPEQLKVSEHIDVPLYERWGRIEQSDLLAEVKQFLIVHQL